MKIAVTGVGYVGLVSGTCFAEMGNDVICVDTDTEKIEQLKSGKIPIYEPSLQDLVVKNSSSGRLVFSTSIADALQMADICFITVGTPTDTDKSADLHFVYDVARDIGQHMIRHMYVVVKSTVPVGTSSNVRKIIQEELDKRSSALTFDVISNPEFLKEGSAVNDCMRPDRVVIGTDSDRAAKIMKELYVHFVRNTEALIFMDIASAEMTKYAANSMLATKISFMNEMSNICELVGADVNKVRLGIGSDARIGYHFIYAGCGYGGSCFPKDVQALIKTSSNYGYNPKILQAVEEVNAEQKLVIPRKVVKRFGEDLSGLTFAVWGLSFKPDTDDMRYGPAIVIINELTQRGAKINAYDPKAMQAARDFYLKDNDAVRYFDNMYSALSGCDAVILCTEWKEFRTPDFDKISKALKNNIIFDGRNQYIEFGMAKRGFEYYPIGIGASSIEWDE